MAFNAHSLDLDGTDQYVTIADGDQTGLDFTGDFTMACHVKLDSEPTPAGTIYRLAGKGTASGNRGWLIFYRWTGSIYEMSIQITDDGTTMSEDNLNTGAIGTDWTHVAVTYDASGGSGEVFYDAVSKGSFSGLDNSIYDNNGAFGFGNHGEATGQYFKGLVDDLVITTDILSSAEITRLSNGYDARKAGIDNIVGYWQFDRSSYADLSGNDNTLTGGNSPTFSTTVPYTHYKPGTPMFFFA